MPQIQSARNRTERRKIDKPTVKLDAVRQFDAETGPALRTSLALFTTVLKSENNRFMVEAPITAQALAKTPCSARPMHRWSEFAFGRMAQQMDRDSDLVSHHPPASSNHLGGSAWKCVSSFISAHCSSKDPVNSFLCPNLPQWRSTHRITLIPVQATSPRLNLRIYRRVLDAAHVVLYYSVRHRNIGCRGVLSKIDICRIGLSGIGLKARVGGDERLWGVLWLNNQRTARQKDHEYV